MSEKEKKEKKKFKVPHVYVIVIALILITAVLTYIIPPGSYEYVVDEATGRNVVDPTSFSYGTEKNPAGFYELITAIPAGMAGAVDTIMMVVLICAAIQIINDTGAMNAGVFAMLRILKGKNKLVLAIMTVLFSLIGGILGWAEGLLIFLPVTVSMAVAMGYDNLLGFMVLAFGGAAGFSSGPMNIYTTGVCQGIAGLQLYSGMAFRWVCWVVFTLIAVFFVLQYATRLEKDIKNSYIFGVEGVTQPDVSEVPEFTTRRKLVFVVMLAGIVISAVGCAEWGWYLQQLSGVFILTGIVGGLVYGMGGTEMANSFSNGAKMIIPSALIIGAARGILYLMETAGVLHTVVYGLAGTLSNFSAVVSAVGINIVTLILNFFVTSATSKAAILMPILAPLGDILDLKQQLIILAYQFGDGFTNYFWPTSGIVMAGIAMAGNIPWDRWAKATWKYMLASVLAGVAMVIVGFYVGVS